MSMRKRVSQLEKQHAEYMLSAQKFNKAVVARAEETNRVFKEMDEAFGMMADKIQTLENRVQELEMKLSIWETATVTLDQGDGWIDETLYRTSAENRPITKEQRDEILKTPKEKEGTQ